MSRVKFYYIQNKSDFETSLSNHTLVPSDIVFIHETNEIWTHGVFYTHAPQVFIKDAGDDAARTILGGDWKIPSKAQWAELVSACNITYVTESNVHCVKFTRKNDSSKFIIIPMSGYYYSESTDQPITLQGQGSVGGYMTSSRAESSGQYGHNYFIYAMNTGESTYFMDDALSYRYNGFTIRPVTSSSSDGVDMGLASGTRWASSNLSAAGLCDNATDYGDYFSWGETSPKTTFTAQNYVFYGPNGDIKYNNDDNLTSLVYEEDLFAKAYYNADGSLKHLVDNEGNIIPARPIDMSMKQDKVDPNLDLKENITTVVTAINKNNENTYDLGFEAGYRWDNYMCSSSEIGTNADPLKTVTDIAKTTRDAATVILGNAWSIPTDTQWTELFSYCTLSLVSSSGEAIDYLKLTSTRNGNYILIGTFGCWLDNHLSEDDTFSMYWSSVKTNAGYDAYATHIAGSLSTLDPLDVMAYHVNIQQSRRAGLQIRPVSKEEGHGVDLGLPSGTRWAASNLSVTGLCSSYTDKGSFFAFGEIYDKSAGKADMLHKMNASRHVSDEDRVRWNTAARDIEGISFRTMTNAEVDALFASGQ